MSIVSRMPFDRSSCFGAGSCGVKKLTNRGQLFPVRIAVGQGRCKELVGAHKGISLPFELDLRILIKVFISCHTRRPKSDQVCRDWSRLGIALQVVQLALVCTPDTHPGRISGHAAYWDRSPR
jgi:hypothetical protein